MKKMSKPTKRKGFAVIIACVVVLLLIVLAFVGSAAIIGDHKGAGDTGEMITDQNNPNANDDEDNVDDDTDPITLGNGPCSQKILQVANGEVGAKENPDGSNQGPNNSPSGRGITNFYKHGANNGAPWCSYFATWVLQTAGEKISTIPQASGVYQWYAKKGQAFTKESVLAGKNTPQPGDIFVKNLSGSGHIGIVTSYSNGIIKTIEGNASDRVKTGTRRITSSDVKGFGRPTCQ